MQDAGAAPTRPPGRGCGTSARVWQGAGRQRAGTVQGQQRCGDSTSARAQEGDVCARREGSAREGPMANMHWFGIDADHERRDSEGETNGMRLVYLLEG